MWQALAACYESIDRPLQAIKAYKRALIANIAYIEPSSSFGSTASASVTSSAGDLGAANTTNVFLDPELLYPIALLHEKQSELETAASYMELVLAQEEGPASIHPDELPLGNNEDDESGGGNGGQGTGVTVTTSKARMWLARWAFKQGELKRAMAFAEELCEDGFEVEEAKALGRDLRSRMEGRWGEL